MKFFAALLVAAASALSLPAAAQDLPGRVGRLAHTEGTVSLYQDPDEGWERAYVNAPITSENSLWTEPNSRAEMRVGGVAVRMDESTQFDVSRLDDDAFDAIVSRGTVAVRVRHFEKGKRLNFTTPNGRFSLRANGRYRIDVDPDRDESRLTVFVGEARVGSDSGRLRVSAGRSVILFGNEYYEEPATSADRFDRWTVTRDERWTETRSIKYVSADMTGYEDLDRHGEWVEEPEFGALWFPSRVESDWAPYRHGRWDYVRPWGWTWIAEEPWGYAPYHYGRWVQVRNRWAWYPGQRTARAAWAPALVAWFGGANLSVGVSSGGPAVGWYPLAPWDRYEPWYNTNTTYVNRINVIVRDSPPRQWQSQQQSRGGDWRYWNRERGATVVNREVLIERRPVRQAQIAVRPEAVRQVQVQAPTQVLPTPNEVQQRRQTARTQKAQQAPVAAPTLPARMQAAQPVQPGQPAQPAQATAPGTQLRRVERPDFARKAPVAAEAPKQASAPPPASRFPTPGKAAAPADSAKAIEERQRADREAYEKQARDNQERLKQRETFSRPVTPAAPAVPAQDGRPATPAVPASAAQEKGQRDAQEKGQRDAQDRAKGAAEQMQQRAQQQQQQAQEKAQRDQQERAKADAQQQLQQRGQQQEQLKQAQEKAQQERSKADALQMQQRQQQQQQQQQQQAQEKAREQQQRAQQLQKDAQERAQKAQQPQQPQQQQAQPKAPVPQPPQDQNAKAFQERVQAQKAAQEKARQDKEKKDKEDEEKGKGRR